MAPPPTVGEDSDVAAIEMSGNKRMDIPKVLKANKIIFLVMLLITAKKIDKLTTALAVDKFRRSNSAFT